VNAAYKHKLGGGDLRFQFSYDNYRYADRFDLLTEDGLVPRSSLAQGDWLTGQLTYQFHAGVLGTLTAGAMATSDLRDLQTDMELRPEPVEVVRIDRPERSGALFLEQEKRLSPRWKIDLGLRLDESRYYGHFLSPRVALAYEPSPKTVYKFIYGHPFRNPNAYEQFYFDNISALQPPQLQPETANTYEFSVERHFTPSLTGLVNIYDYELDHLIQDVYVSDAVAQFQNAASTNSHGMEFELDGKMRTWLDASGSFTLQGVRQNDSAVTMTNSPSRIAKFRVAIPGRRVTLAGSILAMSSRTTWDAESVRPVLLADVTLTLRRLVAGCDLQLGVRNALNWAYQDPVGLSLSTFPGDPRSFYVKLTSHSGK
jgi:outer membrane receptor protein involved in Fe transport